MIEGGPRKYIQKEIIYTTELCLQSFEWKKGPCRPPKLTPIGKEQIFAGKHSTRTGTFHKRKPKQTAQGEQILLELLANPIHLYYSNHQVADTNTVKSSL